MNYVIIMGGVRMRDKVIDPEYVIHGNCLHFACRCCYTKYGREHQGWCEAYRLTNPDCRDCVYFNERQNKCEHPMRKRERKDGVQRFLPFSKKSKNPTHFAETSCVGFIFANKENGEMTKQKNTFALTKAIARSCFSGSLTPCDKYAPHRRRSADGYG